MNEIACARSPRHKMTDLQRRNGPLGLLNFFHELELTGKLNRNFLSLVVLGDTWHTPTSKLPLLQVVVLLSRE